MVGRQLALLGLMVLAVGCSGPSTDAAVSPAVTDPVPSTTPRSSSPSVATTTDGPTSTAAAGVAVDGLTGVDWDLVEVRTGDVTSAIDSTRGAGIWFDATTFLLYDTCNSMSGTYEITDGLMDVENFGGTQAYCDGPVVDAMAAFADAAPGTTTAAVEAGTLVITTGDTRMTFQGAGPVTLSGPYTPVSVTVSSGG